MAVPESSGAIELTIEYTERHLHTMYPQHITLSPFLVSDSQGKLEHFEEISVKVTQLCREQTQDI